MGCTNITPLVLSDTFNTWFERTNECIEGLNTLSLRGLSATNTSGTNIEGFVIEEDNNCFYTVNLRTGPFVGFVGSSDAGYSAGIHGTGSYEDPYNLTLKFTGTETELERAQVATADYLLVSDTSDDQLFKKAPATAFITNLKQGNNIKITENPNDGSFTIAYNEISYIVSNPSVSGTNNWENDNQEIGAAWNGILTFSINTSGNSDVLIASAKVSLSDTDISHFIPAFNSGGYDLNVGSNGNATITVSGLSINFNSYTISNPSINFKFNTTSATEDIEGNPIEALNSPEKQATKSYYMSFRTFFFPGNVPSNAQAAVDAIDLNSNLTNHGLITQPNNRFAMTNLTHGFSQDARFYFLHTVRPNGSGVGYTPELYPNNGNIAEDSNGFFALDGTAQYGGYTYKVWATANSFGGSGINFGVENTA